MRRRPKVGNKVESLLRFSTLADAERDFALRFYAEEGNWDRVGKTRPGVTIALSGTT